jgi:hypothetical protein
MQSRNGIMGQADQDGQNRTGRNGTGRTGNTEWDGQNRSIRCEPSTDSREQSSN